MSSREECYLSKKICRGSVGLEKGPDVEEFRYRIVDAKAFKWELPNYGDRICSNHQIKTSTPEKSRVSPNEMSMLSAYARARLKREDAIKLRKDL